MPIDIYSPNVALLLRGEGATGLKDAGPFNVTPSSTTGLSKATSTYKFGGSSISAAGSGSYITYASFPIAFGTSDITFEGWINFPSSTANQYVISNNYYGGGSGSGYWHVGFNETGYSGKIVVFVHNNSTITPLLVSASTLTTGVWYYLALTRSGNAWRLFINGINEASATFSGSLDNSNKAFTLGSNSTCFIDDFRITIPICRYTGDFTPPASELEIDPLASGSVSRVLKAASKIPDAPTNRTTSSLRVQHQGGYGGVGRVVGTVKLKGSPTNTPLARQTFLLREPDMTLVDTTWSSAIDGSYTFNNIDMSKKYTVIAYDYEHNYRAVIADNLTPERMP